MERTLHDGGGNGENQKVADHGGGGDALFAEVRAHQAIRDVLMRACRGVDRLDAALLLSAYHPGALDHHGGYDGPAEGFVRWVFENHVGRVLSSTHQLANILVELDGDVAHSESYVFVTQRLTVDEVLHDKLSHGRYLDRFERRGGEWRIAERWVVLDWQRFDPVGEASALLPSRTERGFRSRDDRSYSLFANSR